MGLPEKPLLTLEEVIERWKYWGCDRATLLAYAQQDLLVFSVYMRDVGSHKSTRNEGDDVITTEVNVFQFRSKDEIVRRLFYLDADDVRRILESKPNEQVAIHAFYWSTTRIKKSATYHWSPEYLTSKDLVVTREECERFERRHKATGIAAGIRKVSYWIREPSPSNTATRIGGIIVLAASAAWAIFRWYKS